MIRTERGNIWDYYPDQHIVIPTNIGYKRANGANVMGRGLAAQAAKRFPGLPKWYGHFCRLNREVTPVIDYPYAPVILFPVKPYNANKPWLSWKSQADLALIERSAAQLADMELSRVAVSLVGCGNGGLDMGEVRPILDRYLSDSRFTLVLWEGAR